MKMTPFAAYITLKKTVQTDVNGFQVNPAPPLLFLLQKAQEDIQRLEVDNVKWKAAAERSAHEAQVLLDSLEETNQAVEDLANKNSSLHERIAKAEEENSNIHAIKTDYEYKFKENKKKYLEELNELQLQIKDLAKTNKTREKEVHDLNSKLENTRGSLKSCKTEKSQLKINKTKVEIRKLKQKQQKERKETPINTVDFENKDVNANVEIKVLNHAVISSVSSPFISMVSHFVPNLHQSSQKPDEVVPLEPVETYENEYENIELEEKEEGFYWSEAAKTHDR